MDQPNSSSTGRVPPSTQPSWNDTYSRLNVYADEARLKLPAAPPNVIEVYVRYAPWVAIIFGALGVLGLLSAITGAIGLGAFMYSYGYYYGGPLLVTLVFGLVTAALEVGGGYLMLQRRLTGWWLLAAGLAISFLSDLLYPNLLVLIIILAIAYLHLQAKPSYK